jgi:hypothetical protein
MISAIHLIRFLIVASLAFTSLCAAEPNKLPNSVVVFETAATAKFVPPESAEVIALRKQVDAAALDKAIAEAKLELISAGNSRMEILIGIFSILITLLVASFGFATYRQSATAATNAVEARFKLASEKIEYELQKAVSTTGLIDSEHSKALVLSRELQLEISKRSSIKTESNLSEDQILELEEATKIAFEKPRKDRTSEEFRLLIYDAKNQEKWNELLELVEGMLFLHGNNPDDLAFALFHRAAGVSQLGNCTFAASLWKDYLDRCPNDIAEDRAKALSNWSNEIMLLAKTKRGDERNALLSQAKDNLLLAEQLAAGTGSYNLACVYALRNDVNHAVKWLLASKHNGVDFPGCNHIVTDNDFDAIRDSPEFKAALAEIGC